MNNLQEVFKDEIDFVGVYISEAHAVDEWPLGNKYCVKQPRDMETRLTIAKEFVENFNFKIPMLVDTMDNQFDLLFASWPERFYIVRNNKLEHVGEPTDEFGFNRTLLEPLLRTLLHATSLPAL